MPYALHNYFSRTKTENYQEKNNEKNIEIGIFKN